MNGFIWLIKGGSSFGFPIRNSCEDMNDIISQAVSKVIENGQSIPNGCTVEIETELDGETYLSSRDITMEVCRSVTSVRAKMEGV